MTAEYEKQEIEKIKIQFHSQSLIAKELFSALEERNRKYQQQYELSLKHEQNLLKLNLEYSNFIEKSQNRETELLASLELKDQVIGDYVSQLTDIKKINQRIAEEKQMVREEVFSLKNRKTKENLKKCEICSLNKENNTFERLFDEFKSLESQWNDSGEDLWSENNRKITVLSEKLSELKVLLASEQRNSEILSCEEAELQKKMKNLSENNNSEEEIQEKVLKIQSELSQLSSNRLDLQEKQKILNEKLESYHIDKEMLASKLEEVHELLTQEKLASNSNKELLFKEQDLSLSIQQDLTSQKLLNEKVSEQVIQERLSISKIKEQMLKTSDLNTVLLETLKKLDMEGCIKRSEEGFFYNNSPIDLILHSQCFIVVKVGAGLMPLTDYLTTSLIPSKRYSADQKSENSSFEAKSFENSKSPIKPISHIKASKAPLRDRNGSIDRKRIFK